MMKEIMPPPPQLHARRAKALGGQLHQILLPDQSYFIRQVRVRGPVNRAEHVPRPGVEPTRRDVDVLRFCPHLADPTCTRMVLREPEQPASDAPPAEIGMNAEVPQERGVRR